ncbi:DoxX family protein [Streptomyces sp. ST2-7A]|nr:DoxX family protein [Streptomyces sp. ST2-7A]MCE7081619.1 DoxX family protein [Streptomyces sp. ST2-7A]
MLAGLLGTAGVLHFVTPRPFDAIVPRSLPGRPRHWTRISGAAELALAAGLVAPRTRRASALATAVFLVAVLPANVRMARDWSRRPAPWAQIARARVPGQVPLVLWALHAARPDRRPARD